MPEVWAQMRDARAGPSPEATVGHQVLMIIGGHWGGGAAGMGSGLLTWKLGTSSEAAIVVGLIAYPLGVAATSYGIGRAFGSDGLFTRTVAGAYIGAGLGAAVGVPAVLFLAGEVESPGAAFGVLALGTVLYVGGTLAGAIGGYETSVQPTALRRADGRTTAGFRVAFSF